MRTLFVARLRSRMFCKTILYLLFCSLLSASSETVLDLTPCQASDNDCINKNSKVLYEALVQGNPELGIEPIDPMHHDEVEGKLSILSYSLKNSTITGFKKCSMSDAAISLEKMVFKFSMNCPDIFMTGMYNIDGRLIVLPIQGNGDYTLNVKNSRLDISSELKITPGEDGKTYMMLKNYKFNTHIGGLEFDMKNLFNGQQALAEPVLKFMRENWKETGDILQEPVVGANIKKVATSFNKLLKTIPVEKLFVL